ncbi:MAG: acetyl-CoA carboxylase biotin carboxylase subunit [Candidatus Firestonebacteria bacterium]|nr:acetyl-CoA carboxylase biotin carboxylase subunit [Candidatus Firestonebacteria bacterium]
MFKKILIANRGEIALRVIRACREMGIHTVAIHTEADANSLHVRYADEDICIGKGPSKTSYLNIPAILSAAEITDADAIHPGYGFLAENAHFAEICESCHIEFIGPTPKSMRLMGDKIEARRLMKQVGLPMLPGSDGPVENEEDALRLAREIGYPVIIKATAGGGGRGMRVAHTDVSLSNAFLTAQSEAGAAFGNPQVYIEKYLEEPRHVEFQVLADKFGNCINLGERDCTVQRKHQKLIEESPSPIMNQEMRDRIGKLVTLGAKAAEYHTTGTMEFLVDKHLNFYFMEMNTRIQVEHPVTEMVTGLDLIKEQIRVAAGEELRVKEHQIPRGHAIECRINAEDPANNFMPCPGTITSFNLPGGPGVRIDTHAYAGYKIPPYYDSLLAKLITYGADRDEAIARMLRALDEFVIEGIKTTIPFHKQALNQRSFREGRFSTNFVELLLNEKI